MDDGLIASLFLLNSTSTSSDYCSALDEVERRDFKLPEVICIEDSPLTVSSTGTINGETITPCSSVFEEEEEDAPSVEELFVSTNALASLPPVVHIQDDEVSTSCETSCSENVNLQETSSERENVNIFQELNEQKPSLQESESENVNTLQELNEPEPSLQETYSETENININTFQELNEQEPSATTSPGTCVKDFTVPCLETITSLKSRYESKYELHLKLRKVAGCKNKFYRRKLYKYKKDLHQQLDDWEAYLNEQSPNEAYIAVENVVDNEGPPQDFTYVTHNVLHKDMPSHLFDIDYLVGCSCERICLMDACECPRNSGGVFAYDRNGQVRVKPGTPIYECNSRCPCGLSCRNRVLQRGRTVKVAIFRTPNGCGWGVKTMELIEKNQLVTEYVGEAITQEEAEARGKIYDSCGQTYLFDLDFNEGECLYTLDAKKYGNISHFINHSCDPNLDVYAVWVDTLDPNFPRIAFFANRDIKQGEELTFDYQMTLEVGNGTSSPRKREHIKCHCGARSCKTYLF